MIIDCISDLHGHYPRLEGGDLLIVAGDLTARDTPDEWGRFFLWQGDLPYKKIIFMGGNHDNRLQKVDMAFYSPDGKVEYLCDSGTDFEWFETEDTKWGPRHIEGCRSIKVKIWGSPWTLKFKGQNPNCMAFCCDTEKELLDKFSLIPSDTDILVTHSPPFTVRDQTIRGDQVGSTALFALQVGKQINPRLWVFGHIHEGYGQVGPYEWNNTIYVNASHVNERYEPVNKPIRVIL